MIHLQNGDNYVNDTHAVNDNSENRSRQKITTCDAKYNKQTNKMQNCMQHACLMLNLQ